MQDERKPDLGGPDYEELEKKVKEMLDPDTKDVEPPKTAKKIEIDHHESDAAPLEQQPEPATAPPLAKKIEIDHHESDATPIAETAEAIVAADEVATEESEAQPEDSAPAVEEPEPETTDNAEEPVDDTEQESEATEQAEPKPETDEPEQSTEQDLADVQPDDATTEQAINDIVAKEGDDLLAAEDEKLASAFTDKKPSLWQKCKNFFAAWWNNKIARWATIIIVIGGFIAASVVPASRYAMLNVVGVRVSSTVTIQDQSTSQPLKSVAVTIDGVTAQTDDNGSVKLTKLKLGKTTLTIKKRAFAPEQRTITLGLGSNPLGTTQLRPVGVQYDFLVVDYLSGKPIQKVEASSGDASAFSDDNGKIKLTVDKAQDDGLTVLFKKEGMRDETVQSPGSDKPEQTIKLIPARKHVFVTKRSGKYDVYQVDLDGKNEQLVLAGTGKERDDLVLVQHPTENVAVLVSTREGQRNSDGFQLSTLTLIDLSDSSHDSVTQSEKVQVVDWAGDYLIYVQIAAGTSAASANRHRLMSYNYKTGQSKELAASNYFNDVLFAGGKLYYAPSSSYQPQGTPAGFYRIDPDGKNKQTVFDQEVWNAFRTSYDTLTLTREQKWYEYKISGTSKPSKIDGAPASLTNRLYVDSPDKTRSLWVDTRDGKGVLLTYSTQDKQDTIIKTQSGLKNPIEWVNNNVVIYRIATEQETADYVLNLDGGEPRKIRDVSNTGGIDKWYYY